MQRRAREEERKRLLRQTWLILLGTLLLFGAVGCGENDNAVASTAVPVTTVLDTAVSITPSPTHLITPSPQPLITPTSAPPITWVFAAAAPFATLQDETTLTDCKRCGRQASWC
ncbi:MAG: hypothetical protein HC804_07515 [Anaerolineae bacterium]|nr:hypothetical protein [Anaerolineae bacterium]